MTLFSSWFWPDVSSRKQALAAINEAFWITIFLAALNAVFGRLAKWIVSGHPASIIFMALVSLALWHGIRGTLAFHRFAPIAAGTPSIEDSFRSFGQSTRETKQESELK